MWPVYGYRPCSPFSVSVNGLYELRPFTTAATYGITSVLDLDLDLDLDSARIQLDTLGHTPTPSVSVKSCHLCFLPWTPYFVGLCWLRPSSSLLVDLVLSCILVVVPASTVLAVVCAGGPDGRHVHCPSQRSRLSLSMLSMVCCPVLVLTPTLVILSFHEMSSILLCHLWCAASRPFVNVAVNRHTSAPYRTVDRMIASTFTFGNIMHHPKSNTDYI